MSARPRIFATSWQERATSLVNELASMQEKLWRAETRATIATAEAAMLRYQLKANGITPADEVKA